MRKYNGFAHAPIVAGAIAAVVLTGCAGTPEQAAPAAAPPAEPQEIRRAPAPAAPEPVQLRQAGSLRYVVKPGDTLWGIASHFLRDAWQWPEVWVVNRQVANPHLIYPGDVLELVWKDGRPQVERTGASILRMSPRVHEIPLDQAIPAIPIDAIRDFLRGPRIVDRAELEAAPYVVEFVDEHVIAGAGSSVYAAGLDSLGPLSYTAIKIGQAYKDPGDGRILGYEAIPLALAEVREFGPQVATLDLVESSREVRVSNRLLPIEEDSFDSNFFPHAPSGPVGARIISVFDGVSQIGQYSIVALNRGSLAGLEPGHVLSIYQTGRLIKDPVKSGNIQLPDQQAGMLMVFKTTPEMALGLVMVAERSIHVLDRADKPRPSN